MKALMSRKVTRENKDLGDWEPAEHHLTDDGRAEFLARQRKRIADADAARLAAAKSKVQPINRRKA